MAKPFFNDPADSLGRWDAGQQALQENVRSDRDFYNDNFTDNAMSLRSIGLGMGDGNQYQAARRGVDQAGHYADAARSAYGRDMERQGLSTDSVKGKSQQRRLSLSRVISQVDAGNRGAESAYTNQKAAQRAGTEMYGDFISDSNSTLANIARAETDRDSQYRGAKSGSSSSALGIAGSLVAMI